MNDQASSGNLDLLHQWQTPLLMAYLTAIGINLIAVVRLFLTEQPLLAWVFVMPLAMVALLTVVHVRKADPSRWQIDRLTIAIAFAMTVITGLLFQLLTMPYTAAWWHLQGGHPMVLSSVGYVLILVVSTAVAATLATRQPVARP